MHQATFLAFHDELAKIAAAASSPVTQAIPTRKPAGYGLWSAGSDAPPTAAPKEVTKATPLRATKPGPPVPEGTAAGVVPKSVTPELSQTYVRPEAAHVPAPAAAPHVAAPVHAPTPHPGVPGGMGKMVQRGGALLRAHAAPLAIGAGATALGAMALSKMRNKNNASSR